MDFLKVFKHLLPRTPTWSMIQEKLLRAFFQGLANSLKSIREFFDLIYFDLDPQTTRQLVLWETQFALRAGSLTEQERRDRLAAQWTFLGGQSPRYLQDSLQAAGFDVYVHEWWEPIPGRPGGGSIDGDVIPVVRNPFEFLDDGSGNPIYQMFDGGEDAQDGGEFAQDGGAFGPTGYVLVNKIFAAGGGAISDGQPEMQDGGELAQDGGVAGTAGQKVYVIPADPTKFPYFLYIGGAVFPDHATVPNSRREEFEDLCLKICPTEQWLGILVTYS